MTPHMEMDSSKNVKIHINPKHLISSTVHINPKILKSHTIHINPKNFKNVRPTSVHFNPKLINNLSLNNINTSLPHTRQESISIQEIPTNNLQSHITLEEKEKIFDKNNVNQPISIRENNPYLTRNQQEISFPKNLPGSEIRIKLRDKKQKFSTPTTANLERNPLISLSKTKLVRKENIKLKKSLKNESILPLVSISKTKLVRKQQVTNLRRLSVSKKSQKNPNQISPNLISLSKTKLVRKNVLKSSEQSPRNSGTKLIKSKKIITKQTNLANQSLISLSRNKLVRKSQIINKKIKKPHSSRKPILINSPTSNKTISKYKLIHTCKKESKSSNHFKLDNRKVPRTSNSNQQIKKESQARNLPENKNAMILKARAVVRNARKRAIYPKAEGLVWMRKGAKLLPVCRYFLAGCCVKDSCPYLHVKHSTKAPVCLAFLRGQCAQGEKCIRRHVLICPRWDRYGTCQLLKKCRWSHLHPRSLSTKKKIKQEKDTKKQVQEQVCSKPKEQSSEEIEKIDDNKIDRKRYYQRESEGNEEEEKITDNSISDNFESTQEEDEEEDAPFLAKRPKIGKLPAFIPLS